MKEFHFKATKPLGDFFDSTASLDSAHDKPDGEGEGSPQNQEDNEYYATTFHNFGMTDQRTAVVCNALQHAGKREANAAQPRIWEFAEPSLRDESERIL